VLDKLARYFADLELEDFEPPVGTERLEEFLDAQWGAGAPRTYNKNLSIVKRLLQVPGPARPLHGDPTLAIERARKRDVYRTTFTTDQRRAIIAEPGGPARPDRAAAAARLRAPQGRAAAVQFKHFDHVRKRLTIFTKGEKVRELPIPDPAFWHDLERHILDVEASRTTT
jgi:hypothetical protein